MRRTLIPTATVVVFLSVCVEVASASGSTPMMAQTRSFSSFAACRDALAVQWTGDRRRATVGWIDQGNGTHLARELLTDGIVSSGNERAVYRATLWTHAARVLDNSGERRYEIAHSFEERMHSCAGPDMITSGRNGFTQQTFERTLPAVRTSAD